MFFSLTRPCTIPLFAYVMATHPHTTEPDQECGQLWLKPTTAPPPSSVHARLSNLRHTRGQRGAGFSSTETTANSAGEQLLSDDE